MNFKRKINHDLEIEAMVVYCGIIEILPFQTSLLK